MRTLLAWCGVAALVPPLYAVTLTDGENLLPVGASHAAFAAAMAVPLAWARRRPGVVLAVVLSGAVAAMVLGAPAQRFWPLFPAADVLVCLLAAARSRRAGLAAAAVALLVQETAYQVDLARHGLRAGAPGFAGLAGLLGLGVAVAWLAGTFVRQRRAYELALRAHAEARTVTEERLRIARELHDMVAHSIGVIAIQAGAGARVIDDSPERAREALEAIEATGRQTLKGLRHLLGVLRAPEDGHPGAPGSRHPGVPGRDHPGPSEGGRPGPSEGGRRGGAAFPAGLDDLDRLVRTTTAAGLRVDVRRRGEPRPLPAAVDRSAFRIIQESVTNVLRHAGADHCRVVIDHGEEDLRIEVVDDGPATARSAARPAVVREGGGGHGITGMRERVALLDGDFDAGPRPGGGFRVTARLPLADEPDPRSRGQKTFFRNGSSAAAVRSGNSDIG
ncbi:sensor histidine kinase [Nonomuraea montanisoli]|uniref:sensor histidine kinase n=1 Tax=Nonomuraea montanisoli TaxID=2741721 RepID=UPI002E2C6F3F|nr:histidine kinase [Nonomuraea montanisoli]